MTEFKKAVICGGIIGCCLFGFAKVGHAETPYNLGQMAVFNSIKEKHPECVGFGGLADKALQYKDSGVTEAELRQRVKDKIKTEQQKLANRIITHLFAVNAQPDVRNVTYETKRLDAALLGMTDCAAFNENGF